MTAGSSRLDGRRALVTGASRGIGAHLAGVLAGAGADVVLAGRAAGELEALAAALRAEHGVRAAAVVADLASPTGPDVLAAAALEAFGGLDVLVNNAGTSVPEPVVDTTTSAFDDVLAVNLRAPALLAARVGAAMVEAGTGGKIINIASAAALRALPEHYAYCASKAGLLMATKVLALELGPHGVQANSICPTVVLTEMGQRVWGEAAKAAPMLARIPTGRFAALEDLDGAVLFLAGSGSDMVNGIDLPVDGGYSVS